MQPDPQSDLDAMVADLRAALDADESWALACNRPYEYADEGSVAPPTGVHWRWVAGDHWDTVEPKPSAGSSPNATARLTSRSMAGCWPARFSRCSPSHTPITTTSTRRGGQHDRRLT